MQAQNETQRINEETIMKENSAGICMSLLHKCKSDSGILMIRPCRPTGGKVFFSRARRRTIHLDALSINAC
jgi:hypothetical protein